MRGTITQDSASTLKGLLFCVGMLALCIVLAGKTVPPPVVQVETYPHREAEFVGEPGRWEWVGRSETGEWLYVYRPAWGRVR